jgi:ATP-dependent exoDNAse (exonuclease V) beta subunit
VWGIGIVPETREVDLENLLGNRWLRYWLNPYGDQFKGTLLAERIDESAVKTEKLKEALAEETRLLYVGITRARDYLVFPTRQKQAIWLNRVCHDGNEDHAALFPDSSQTTWEWNGETLAIETEVFHFPNDFPQTERPAEEILFREERAGKRFHLPYLLDLGKATYQGDVKASVHSYASPFSFPEIPERHALGKAFQAYLTAYQGSYGKDRLREMASGLLERYQVGELFEAEVLVQNAEAYFAWLKREFSISKVHRRFPLYMFKDGRIFEPVIDLLLETEEGLVVILYTSFIGDEKSRMRKAKDMAAWLQGCKEAAQIVFDKSTVRTWVHLVLYGSLVEVEL